MERKPACSSGVNFDAWGGKRAGRTEYMEKDLTSGSVLKNIFTFSLPYLLSYFLQTLYGMADLFIIGQFEGVASTTAVSIGSQVMHMITVILVGVAMGTTVCIGRSVGAGDKKQAAKVIGNTVTLFMVGSVVLAAALVGLVDPIVRLISTPEEAVAGTTAYLTICFIGIPCITAYNVLASIFRGMGDSRSPMYFIAAACVVNIGLDFFFMGALRLGPAGAALGTTLSQAVSVLLALCVILKRKSIRLSKSDFCPRKATMKDILSIGLPVAAQVRAMLPQFCGISGSTSTMFSMTSPPLYQKTLPSIKQFLWKFNIKIIKKGDFLIKILVLIADFSAKPSFLPFSTFFAAARTKSCWKFSAKTLDFPAGYVILSIRRIAVISFQGVFSNGSQSGDH